MLLTSVSVLSQYSKIENNLKIAGKISMLKTNIELYDKIQMLTKINKTMTQEEKIIENIIDELEKKYGFNDWWDKIKPKTKKKIKSDLMKLILKQND